MAKARKLAVELKVDWRTGSLSWRVPSEGSKWAFVDEHKKDAWLKRYGVPKSAIADLKRRDKTTFKTSSIDTWQELYGIEEDAGTLSGMKNKGGSMSNLSKMLLIGSVGIVGIGAFMYWRSKKLAREMAFDIVSSPALGAGYKPGYVAGKLNQSALLSIARNG